MYEGQRFRTCWCKTQDELLTIASSRYSISGFSHHLVLHIAFVNGSIMLRPQNADVDEFFSVVRATMVPLVRVVHASHPSSTQATGSAVLLGD